MIPTNYFQIVTFYLILVTNHQVILGQNCEQCLTSGDANCCYEHNEGDYGPTPMGGTACKAQIPNDYQTVRLIKITYFKKFIASFFY